MSTVKKVRIHVQTVDGLVGIHPETSIDQVLDPTTGLRLGSILSNIGSSQKFDSYSKLIKSTSDGQTRFEFDDPEFSENDTILVFVSGEFMHIGEEFTIDTSGTKPAIVFNDGYPSGVGVFVLVLRNSSDSNNSGFTGNSIESYNHVNGEVLNAEQYKVESSSLQLTNGVPLKEQDSSLEAGDLSAPDGEHHVLRTIQLEEQIEKLNQELAKREINEITLGKQLSDLELRLIELETGGK